MTLFLKNGVDYRVATDESMDLHRALPAGNYTIKVDMTGNFYLSQIDSFEMPSKLYGSTTRYTSRIINTFKERGASTGVLLNGEKGSGKTLLAKNISIELAKEGVPTIILNNEQLVGDGLFTMLQNIEQPCVIFLDEYEKTFSKETQEQLLTMFDGVFSSKKLFLLTVNDKYRVDTHLRNRPGRLHYLIDFFGIDSTFIEEYCEDNLNNKTYISNICSIASLFSAFTFDMLKALVKEMNMYDESPADALELLNIKPEFDSGSTYTITSHINGKDITEKLYNKQYYGNPLAQNGIQVEYLGSETGNEEDEEYMDYRFTTDKLVRVDAKEGTFEFHDNDCRLLLTRKKEETGFNYSHLL